MADYTTHQKSSSTGWIIGAIVVVLVLLFIVFAGGTPTTTTGEGVVPIDGNATIEQAPVTVPDAAPAATE